MIAQQYGAGMRREFNSGVAQCAARAGRLCAFALGAREADASSPRAVAQPDSHGLHDQLGLWLTGAVWLIAHYVLVYEGEFGPLPHPLEFWSVAAHGAFGFASLWLLGLLWSVHIPAGWRASRRRLSGSMMFGVVAFLILSGYLLYYLGNAEVISVVAYASLGGRPRLPGAVPAAPVLAGQSPLRTGLANPI